MPPLRRKSLIEKAIDVADLGDIGDIDAILGSGPIPVPDAATLEAEAVPSAVPHEVTNDDGSGPLHDEGPTPLPPPWVLEDVDDPSGPRVVASMGADSASAAGEVERGDGDGTGNEPARELVTILPKRSTREIPVISLEEAEAFHAQALVEAAAASAASEGEMTATEVNEADVLDEQVSQPIKKIEGVGKPRRPRTLPPPPGKPVTAAAERPPPNQQGRRWPAVVIGALSVAVLTFLVVRAGKGGSKGRARAAIDGGGVVAVAIDAGVDDAELRPSQAVDRGHRRCPHRHADRCRRSSR